MDFLKNLLGIARTPLHFLYFIYQHPVVFTSILLFGCLIIRLLYKLGHKNYEGNEDMKGITVLITGATDGRGKATAFDLARRNARVLLACRNVEKGNEVAEEIKSATGNQNVIVKYLDLCSFESVRECAKRILETEDKLHVLINNACILGAMREMTNDGCDKIMQTNHFGHSLLTLLLLDLLKRSSPSRVINMSSREHMFAKFDVEDLNNYRGIINPLYVYYNSQLAKILFTKELAERLKPTSVTVNVAYPSFALKELEVSNIMTTFLFFLFGHSFEESAQTTIKLAVDPVLETTTGKVFFNCMETCLMSEEAADMMLAKRLFQQTERIIFNRIHFGR